MSSGVKKSGAPCGPYSTPISHSFAYCGINSAGALRVQPNGGPSSAMCNTSPARSTRPACPPNPPRMNVLRLSKYSGTSMPPEIARYARLPRTLRRRHLQRGARRNLHGIATAEPRVPSSRAPKSAPVSAITVSLAKRSVGPSHRDLQPRGGIQIPHQPVSDAKRQRVHRTGRRHAHMPITDAPRIILHRGLRAGSITSIALR